jgi:hypothetical protein
MSKPQVNYVVEVPTLVVGMGGLGCNIVERVYERLDRRGGLSDQVAWHVIDTNSHDLAELRYLHSSDDQFTQLGKGVTSHIVGLYQHTYPASKAWFPFGPIINPTSTLEGAGQIRGVSRLTFMEQMSRTDGELGIDRAVAKLRTIAPSVKGIQFKPRVIVVTSLAGGTGAGSFISLALYLRQAVADTTGAPPDTVVVRGFFVLPDVFVGNDVLPSGQHDRVRANAVACVKEIEAIREHVLLNSAVPVPLEYRKAGGAEPAIIPYDYAYLFDYHTEGGGNLRNYEQYMEQISDAIHVALFTPLGTDGLSIEDNFIAGISTAGGRNTYGGAAVAELRFPVERVVDYLVARWTSAELDEIWLRADRRYHAVLERFEADKEKGIYGPEPSRGAVFLDFLDRMAASDDVPPLFRQLRAQTHQLDAEGVPRPDATRAAAWLNELTGWVASTVLRDAATDKGPSLEKVSDRETAVSAVTAFEERLASRKREIKRLDWRSISTALATQAMIQDADEGVLRRGEGRYRILHWLFDDHGAVHPLAVRYFLYQAQGILDRALLTAENDVDRLWSAVDAYEERWDIKETAHIESATDRVRQALAQPAVQRIFRDDLKAFVTQYVSRSRRQAAELQKYHNDRLVFEVLRRVKAYVDEFVEEWESAFDGLRLRKDRLTNDANRLESEHEPDAGTNPTVQFVFAGVQSKVALWEEFKRLIGSSQASAAQSAAFEAVYRRVADQQSRKEARNSILDEFLGGMTSVIREAIWAQGSAAKTSLGAKLPSDVFEALRREAEVLGRQPDDHAAIRVGGLQGLAVPFVQPSVGASIERFDLWGLNDALKERVPGPVGASMGRTQFSPAFSPYEIVYYRVHAGYEARELRRFIPAPVGDGMQFVAGPYYEAYQRQLAEYRAALAKRKPGAQEPLPVHLDKRWVDTLPDFWATNVAELIDRTLVRGVALGEFTPVGANWTYRGTALAPFGKAGSLRGLRTALGRRPDIAEQVNESFEERSRDDAEKFGMKEMHTRDQYHTFVRGFRSSRKSDHNMLALVADMIFTTNKNTEGMQDVQNVFRLACDELRRYLRRVYPGDEESVAHRTEYILDRCNERENWVLGKKKEPEWMKQLGSALKRIKSEAV